MDDADLSSNSRTKLTWQQRLAPALLLFFTAPLFGEYLLGNVKFSEFILLPFLAVLYGAGALLIREVTRRAGRGYATMLGLGVAYTLVEEGLVDQMLFNPAYFAGQKELMTTMIPALGLDAWLTLIATGMHAIWSICIPIVLVEAIFRKRGTQPWVGKTGLGITAGIFVFGSLWIGQQSYLETGFWASPGQLTGTAIMIVVITAATLIIRRRPRPTTPGFVPSVWIAGGAALLASSLYMLTEYLPGWTRVIACVLVAVGFFAVIYQWSRYPGWSGLHTLALAGGGTLTYAWLGVFMEPETGPKTAIDHIGTAIFIAYALWLLVVAVRRLMPLKSGSS